MKKRPNDRNVYPNEVYEHEGDAIGIDPWDLGSPSKPRTIWLPVPRICGNCPLAYDSTKCKRTSCKVKSLRRRGIEPVY